MKIFKKTLIALSIIIILAAIWAVLKVFPAISGFGAKNMCSSIYLQGRSTADLLDNELSSFPLRLGSFTWNEPDSTVIGSVFGFAERKAIYRKGLGCTLVNDVDMHSIKEQEFDFPLKPNILSDTVNWPIGDKVADGLSEEINKPFLELAIQNAMDALQKDGSSAGTRAVLVLYDGEIIGERYHQGFDKHTVMLGWSVSKSITSALIGILVKKGQLNIDQNAPIPIWKGTDKEEITIKNLLHQASGLDFLEKYNLPSDATRMLFNEGDMSGYTASLSLKHSPGSHFSYSSGNSNILSKIIRNTAGEKAYSEFPYLELFHKINAYSFLLEPDASGTYIGSSYCYATARDFARFGLLYYQNGLWNGEQILSENWVKESIEPTLANDNEEYGYQFWLNGYSDSSKKTRKFPDAPADLFYASGYGGQHIFIIPSKKLIVLRFGVDRIDINQFLKEVIKSVNI